jgi:hypothetical protein
MRRHIARIRGVGFLLWHGKHMLIHLFLGLLWAWFLRELWQEFNTKWVILAMFGSWLPDADHVVYFFTYGKRDPYSNAIREFIKTRQWRVLIRFVETGHKYNTNLSFHNLYITLGFFGACILSYLYDWKTSVVIFGAMVSHYLFDIAEDIVVLGYVNPNWKRFGPHKADRNTGIPEGDMA